MSVNIIQKFQFNTEDSLTAQRIQSEFENIVGTVNGANAGLLSWDKVRLTTTVFIASGNTTAVTETILVIKKTVGAATGVTLSTSPVSGQLYIVKDGKGDANANNITVTPASGTIDGAANKVINSAYGVLRLFYNGTEWNTW